MSSSDWSIFNDEGVWLSIKKVYIINGKITIVASQEKTAAIKRSAHQALFKHATYFLISEPSLVYTGIMPKVFECNGYKFFFFSNEGRPLEKCHIHVRKDEALAKFWITDTAQLADSYGFTATELHTIETILNQHINSIKEAWNGFFSN